MKFSRLAAVWQMVDRLRPGAVQNAFKVGGLQEQGVTGGTVLLHDAADRSVTIFGCWQFFIDKFHSLAKYFHF